MRHCRTCRYFSWTDYHFSGLGHCEICRVGVQPESDADKCNIYQFDPNWRHNSTWALQYALETKRLLYPGEPTLD